MNEFNLNDYMLDGTLEDALWGDLHAKSAILRECRAYQKRGRKPPEKLITCLRNLQQRKRGRSRRDSFMDYFIASHIVYLREEGYKWDKIKKKCDVYFGTSISRKSLEALYYSHLKKYQAYRASLFC
jgi:hypothetical protein